ncbi:MAG: type II toxin-antitoxin system PemK/MazF family toxin [bacterium]|nr:type II toxin-antitoxin system PemK/MazF family toxin [bacterium]
MKKPGQIVVFKFPKTDLKAQKPRPCVLLNPVPGPFDDWLVAMISTQTRHYIEGMDEIIQPDSHDFKTSGLKTVSVIRVARLAVVEGDILIGAIGKISRERLEKIRNNLVNWIKSDGETVADH